MRDTINKDLKEATLARDKDRTATLRLISAAIKDRDIVARGAGGERASDPELIELLAKMIKQREESARLYDEGGRPELADKERGEIAVIRTYLPQQLDEAATSAAIDRAIADSGAASIKDMGKVMALLKERHAGQMDFSKASAAVRAKLG